MNNLNFKDMENIKNVEIIENDLFKNEIVNNDEILEFLNTATEEYEPLDLIYKDILN